ncbi:hypothetical protein Sjap_007164 [Stephania japonica]|uniref:non-specific serine/threonine protein kinase n=1 Tax=Stephania japonica TaxID=461633 RepID=A0AAP0PDF8_9MAGN
MGSPTSNHGAADLWAEIVATEAESDPQQNPEVAVIYRRRGRAGDVRKDAQINRQNQWESRPTLAPNKRVSWNRSLNTRGRSSISISSDVDHRAQLKQKEAKKKSKHAPPNRRIPLPPPRYEKEKEYFREVDAVELIEESPSPKNFVTWAEGLENDQLPFPHLSTRLGKWLASKKLDLSYGPSGSLFNIMENPVLQSESSVSTNEKTPERPKKLFSAVSSFENRVDTSTIDINLVESHACSQRNNKEPVAIADQSCVYIEEAIKRLSLSPQPALLHVDQRDPFASLLRVCNQSTPSRLIDVLTQCCDPGSVVKVGEGTYGEAFIAGATVCKVVPIDGDLRVNGEMQKRSAELLEEVLLSRTLNHLRGHAQNACTSFIETIDLKVCQGSYDAALIRAWEDWDIRHGSENDHPRDFPETQCYVAFVLAHGGKDLESFVLLNFDEARSLIIQVTAGLAVAEAAYEFEHRDLHWGNILLSRKEGAVMSFTLEGRQMLVKTFGLSVSMIDFTLSRINTGTSLSTHQRYLNGIAAVIKLLQWIRVSSTGEAIHFLDLSRDPELFEGPKGDRQAETYRKMREVTEEYWEGSFPKTNVLWLQYLVDILLLKKSFKRASSDERELRSLKKRLSNYSSAKEAIFDPFFSSLLTDQSI